MHIEYIFSFGLRRNRSGEGSSAMFIPLTREPYPQAAPEIAFRPRPWSRDRAPVRHAPRRTDGEGGGALSLLPRGVSACPEAALASGGATS